MFLAAPTNDSVVEPTDNMATITITVGTPLPSGGSAIHNKFSALCEI